MHLRLSSLTIDIYSIYGISCLQTYIYYVEHSYKDGTFLKTFVSLLDFLTSRLTPRVGRISLVRAFTISTQS
jgi:hypothetical protein